MTRERVRLVWIGLLAYLMEASSESIQFPKDAWSGFSVSCSGDDPQNISISCHGVNYVRKIVQQLLTMSAKQKNVKLFEGIKLVDLNENGSQKSARVLKGIGGLGSMLHYLEGKELRIKLANILPSNVGYAIGRSLETEIGRGKGGKKGDSSIILLGLMMGKMMIAMGLSALGALVMKALLVSALALMLSLITAVKKLATKDDKEEHHIIYAKEIESHRRRRSASIQEKLELSPYRGHIGVTATDKKSTR